MDEQDTYETIQIGAVTAALDRHPFTGGDILQSVLLRVRLRCSRRIGWLRKIWIERNSEQQNTDDSGFHSEVDAYLKDDDAPADENIWYTQNPVNIQINRRIAETESILANDKESRLAILCQIFGLDQMEKDFLQACIAIALDPNLAVVYAYLQDHKSRGFTTGYLVARLFEYGRYLTLSPASNLKTWQLVEETPAEGTTPTRYTFDPFILGWILGQESQDKLLIGKIHYQKALKPLAGFPFEAALEILRNRNNLSNQISISETKPVTRFTRLIIYGPEGSGRKTLAASVSERLHSKTIFVNCDRIEPPDWAAVFIHAQRFALLNRMNLGWYGLTLHEKSWPQLQGAVEIQFLIAERDQKIPPTSDCLDRSVNVPDISADERQRLWMELVPSSGMWDRTETMEMIRCHRSTIGQITTVGTMNPDSITSAREILNASNSLRLGELAHRLNCTFVWDDLVIPKPIKQDLEDFCFEARDRIVFWESAGARRLFPLGKGLIALFNGGPGTGKTMAAQVIAASLQLDLYRVDLSTMVSKYIGETAKNIERILSRAEEMDVVLFFDEADALFSKRTEVKDAHDRFANTDTNFLLQAIEQYPGIAILATNKKGNMDPGFTRRIRYVVDFPKPDAASRLIIWYRVIKELLGKAAVRKHAKDLEHIAAIADMTGAQIKQSVLSGIFMARRGKARLSTTHLLRGIERELQKEGRGLGRSADSLSNK
jgi:hypothetical protein